MKSDRSSSGRRTSSFWNALGLNAPKPLDDHLAPQVDRALLQQLVRGDLSAGTARRLYSLIDAFRSWHEAYVEVSLANYRDDRPES